MGSNRRPAPLPPRPEDLRAHTTWLRRLAVRLVGSSSLADDVAQETWVAACANPPARAEAWRSWLRTVLHNCVRAWARADRSRGRRDSAAGLLLDDDLPSSEELLVRHEALAFVAEEVRRLKEPYRSTVLLCYAEEVPPTEIARRQGLPAGTVRWRLKQGLDELRRRVEQRYGQDRRAWCVAFGLPPAAAEASPGAGVAKAAAGLAVGLLLAASLALSWWLVTPGDSAGPPLPGDQPPRSARLADAGPPLPEPWSQAPAPLLVEADIPDDDAPGARLRRM
jgi:RNA polymerase sigma factor (sigma-70 family)